MTKKLKYLANGEFYSSYDKACNKLKSGCLLVFDEDDNLIDNIDFETAKAKSRNEEELKAIMGGIMRSS